MDSKEHKVISTLWHAHTAHQYECIKAKYDITNLCIEGCRKLDKVGLPAAAYTSGTWRR